MKKLAIITAITALLLVGVYYLIGSMIPKKGGPNGAMGKAVEVTAVSVKKRSVAVYKELPARIRSMKISQVRPQVSGIILKKYFTEGSFVKKGDPLYQIDPEPYFIEHNQAKVELSASKIDLKGKKDNFERLEKLYQINAVSKLEFDNANTAFELAKANLAIKQAALDKANIKINYTKVLAPISGKIGKSYVTQGALVSEMQTDALAIITDLDMVYADIVQSSLKIQEIQQALNSNNDVEVELIIPEGNEKIAKKGILKFSESIIDESTGAILMRAEFENEDHKLLPGLFAKAKLNLGNKDLLTVEQSAVLINPDGTMMVYLIDENNVVQPKNIKINGEHEKDWIVSNGLKEGDLVVKEGLQKIQPGAKVNPSLASEELINTTEKNLEEQKKEDENKNVKIEIQENQENKNRADKKEIEKKEKISDLNKMDKIIGNSYKEESQLIIEQDKVQMYEEKINNFVKNKLETAEKEIFSNRDIKGDKEQKNQEQSSNIVGKKIKQEG